MNMEGVTNGRYADLYSPVRPFTPEERAKVQEQMQATYDAFVEKAAAGRNTTPERIDAIGAGARVDRQAGASRSGWSTSSAGSSARSRSRSSARRSRRTAEVELVVYPGRKSIYEIVQNPFGGSERTGGARRARSACRDPRALQTLTAPLRVFRRGEPLAIMPNVFVR